ncbi:MAG: hypothetical protein IPM76_23895 [Chloroflexi bacterium]|nr:hypothetical protein [Chloroflexota bacterium]
MSSALDNPATALHILSYKAALPVLVAMFMPDCPTPVSVKWLMHRTGVKARKTINETLDYLEYLGVIAQIMTANKGWWSLTDKESSFLCHFTGSLAAGAQPLSAPGRVTILDQDAGASSQLPLLRFAQTAGSRPSAQSDDAIPMVASGGLDAGDSPIVSKFYPPPLKNVVVVLTIRSPDQSLLKNNNNEGGWVHLPHNRVLHEIGMGEPVPTDYGDYPLQMALAYWWYALAEGMNSPHGYLRRRMEQGHVSPPDDYLQVASLWLTWRMRSGLIFGMP